MVSRITFWMSSSAWVVTSPMTTHRPLVMAVSHATRAAASWASMPSRIASETWSQTLSGCPSVTDSEVSRKEGELEKVFTPAAMIAAVWGAASGPLNGGLFVLGAQEPLLQLEDVVQDPGRAAALEAVVGDQAGPAEQAPQARAQAPVNPLLPRRQRLLQEVQAAIECLEPGLGRDHGHQVPSTCTRPPTTRTMTWPSVGSG